MLWSLISLTATMINHKNKTGHHVRSLLDNLLRLIDKTNIKRLPILKGMVGKRSLSDLWSWFWYPDLIIYIQKFVIRFINLTRRFPRSFGKLSRMVWKAYEFSIPERTIRQWVSNVTDVTPHDTPSFMWVELSPGPLLLTWINLNPSMDW